MNRNLLYLIVGVLAAATAGLGYRLYEERQNTASIQMDIGNHSISIEKH